MFNLPSLSKNFSNAIASLSASILSNGNYIVSEDLGLSLFDSAGGFVKWYVWGFIPTPNQCLGSDSFARTDENVYFMVLIMSSANLAIGSLLNDGEIDFTKYLTPEGTYVEYYKVIVTRSWVLFYASIFPSLDQNIYSFDLYSNEFISSDKLSAL